jgi:hypothetical protein
MGGVIEDFDIEYRGESAQALGSDAKGIDRVVDLYTQLFQFVGGSALQQFRHINRPHQ